MTKRPTRIGVLALQGDFAEHVQMLRAIGVEAVEVRKPEHLDSLDGLIIPGGESTTFGKLALSSGLKEPLRKYAASHPTWGTCAGAIFLANHIEGEPPHLGLMDISIRRNAFGRQIDSFTQPLKIKGINGGPYRAVFIRAPIITGAGSKAEVLSTLDDGTIVA
ncbi:MAG TPA: pyridoxal 5'-phosphate synthase glutaminase subunit PdxT, partial [Aggregatilineales bacterium]|nr:pyridoxal 5'-phosphate synthase glutaminase subunit PdxT [Aggregatilineales bacterium]